jgi:hypothetical protein
MLWLWIPKTGPDQAVRRLRNLEHVVLRFKGVTRMQENEKNPLKNHEELKNKRKVLFRLFLKNPMYTSLAVEIKALDDQLADWTRLLTQK